MRAGEPPAQLGPRQHGRLDLDPLSPRASGDPVQEAAKRPVAAVRPQQHHEAGVETPLHDTLEGPQREPRPPQLERWAEIAKRDGAARRRQAQAEPRIRPAA